MSFTLTKVQGPFAFRLLVSTLIGLTLVPVSSSLLGHPKPLVHAPSSSNAKQNTGPTQEFGRLGISPSKGSLGFLPAYHHVEVREEVLLRSPTNLRV